jgi:signal transduction histidine kinase
VRVIQRDEWLEFSVIDSGPGLAPGSMDKLFQPFFTTKREGMGMGLNICRSIIESHKGRLWVEDNPGGGCVFRFTLPVTGQAVLVRAA